MKKLVVAFCIAIVAATSQASYLWFTVDSNDTGYGNISSYLTALKDAGAITDSYDIYARVVAVNGTDKTTFSSDTPFETEWQMAPAQATVNLGSLTGDGFSYYIEIATSVDGVYNPVGRGEAVTYNSLVDNGCISTLADVPAATVWHGSGYRATPEPTSAMLMLLGVAGLALRRKQRKLA